MSKAEIISELPKLALAERREIFARLCELEDQDLISGSEPTLEEKVLLDKELEEYRKNPGEGSNWSEAATRLRQ